MLIFPKKKKIMTDSTLPTLNKVHLRTQKKAQERMKGRNSEDLHSSNIKMKGIVSFRYQIRSRTFSYSL